MHLGYRKPDQIPKRLLGTIVEGLAVSCGILEPEQSEWPDLKFRAGAEKLSFEQYKQLE